MQIVINMDEQELILIHKSDKRGIMDSISKEKLVWAIRNGILLPKSHGDLIDRNEVLLSMFDFHKGKKSIGQCIDDVKTIIQADKESD